MITGPARLPSLSLSLSPLPRPIVLPVNVKTLGREGEGREQVSTPRTVKKGRVAQSPVIVLPTVSLHPIVTSLSLSLSPSLSPPLPPPLPLSLPLSLSLSLPLSLSLSLSRSASSV